MGCFGDDTLGVTHTPGAELYWVQSKQRREMEQRKTHGKGAVQSANRSPFTVVLGSHGSCHRAFSTEALSVSLARLFLVRTRSPPWSSRRIAMTAHHDLEPI